MTANMTDDGPVNDLKTFFRTAMDFKLLESGNEDRYQKLTVIRKRTNETVLTGQIDLHIHDPNVGYYAVFWSTTSEGLMLMHQIHGSIRPQGNAGLTTGFTAIIEHKREERKIADSYSLVVVSGDAPDGEHSLATRFTLYEGDEITEEVGRCHLTYRDGSYDPSMGPTIEALAIKQSYRGKGLSKLLWFWVRCFIEENVTIECLNNDAPLRHTMVKVTQLCNTEVDISGDGKSISDKDFFYNYCGFSVRAQKGVMASMMSSRRPLDEEAVLYIPLLEQKELRRRKKANYVHKHCPTPGDASFRLKMGARCCDACNRIAKGHSRCSRCGDAYYCDERCQTKHWKRHKKWCNKTQDQIRDQLAAEGVVLDDL
jgi:hypothetical protein